MKTASQILEEKGYEGDEIDSILNWASRDQESLDLQTRKHFGIESEPVHIWDRYYLGDADEENLQKIAKGKGYESYQDLLNAADIHLLSLAESYPDKN